MGDNYGLAIQKGVFNTSNWFIEKTEKIIKAICEQIEIIENMGAAEAFNELKEKCEKELLDLCNIYCFLNDVEPDSELNKELIVNNENMLEKLKVHYGLSEMNHHVDEKKEFSKFSKEVRKALKSNGDNRIAIISNLISKNKENLSTYGEQIKSIEECIANMEKDYIAWDMGKVIIRCILDNCKKVQGSI